MDTNCTACCIICAAAAAAPLQAFALVRGPVSFVLLRLILGLAESGAIPGVWYYVSLFYPANKTTLPYSLIETGITVSQVGELCSMCPALMQQAWPEADVDDSTGISCHHCPWGHAACLPCCCRCWLSCTIYNTAHGATQDGQA